MQTIENPGFLTTTTVEVRAHTKDEAIRAVREQYGEYDVAEASDADPQERIYSVEVTFGNLPPKCVNGNAIMEGTPVLYASHNAADPAIRQGVVKEIFSKTLLLIEATDTGRTIKRAPSQVWAPPFVAQESIATYPAVSITTD